MAASNRYERIADCLILAVLFFTIAASFKTTEVLTVGDWEMWVDWKDREWWPLLYPLFCITFPAVSQGKAGLRVALTLHQTADDIRALVDAIAARL